MDVLKRMLVVDPNEWISWEELFVHPINKYREKMFLKKLKGDYKNKEFIYNYFNH